jgi:class 3 adenylate cyclase
MIAPDGAMGRFPAHAETRVAEKIQSELAGHNVGYGYGSLACGADTLIVEALLARNAEVDVVLPFGTDAFLKESAANSGPNWLDRIARCLKQVRVVHATEDEYGEDAEVFAYASRLAMGLTMLRAQQLASEPIQLAVWDGRESGEKAGTFVDIRTWQSRGLKTITVNSEGNGGANITNAGARQQSHRPLPPRKVRAIMFGDFHGFSQLSDRQMLSFYDHVALRVAAVLDRYGGEIDTRNTWGDGLFVVFSDLVAAARCALDIQLTLAELDFHSLGLPSTLGFRLGLDAGVVFEVQDPILKSLSFTGHHINRTARLEPSIPPGEVFVTEAFAALFTLVEHRELICEYVGMIQAAKNYGRLRTYLLRRRAFSGSAP